MSVMRSLILALPMAAILAACGNAPVVLSEEEKAARVTVNPFSENLTPDPTLASATIALPAAQPSTDWPQAGVNSSKHPVNVTAGSQFKVDWRVGVGEGSGELKRIVAAPVARDGRIYTIDSNQRVVATDINSGKRVWENKLKAANPKWDEYTVGAGLAITGDKLIVASGFAYVTALSLADGKEIWHRRVDSPLSSSPAILGNRAFLTSTNNDFYAVDTDDGEILWNDQALSESARVLSSPSPAVTQDILVCRLFLGRADRLPAGQRPPPLGRHAHLHRPLHAALGDQRHRRQAHHPGRHRLRRQPLGHPHRDRQPAPAHAHLEPHLRLASGPRHRRRLSLRCRRQRQGRLPSTSIDGKIAWTFATCRSSRTATSENRIVWTGPLLARMAAS